MLTINRRNLFSQRTRMLRSSRPQRQYIGDLTDEQKQTRKSLLYSGFTLLLLLLLLASFGIGLAALISFLNDKPTNIKHLNTVVNPTNNNVNLVVRTDINGGLAIEDNTLASGVAGTSSIALRNTGVLTVTTASGLANIGTAQDPIINNTGVLAVLPDTGISISGPQSGRLIRNEGVLSVTGLNGIVITGTAQNPIVENDGVLSVTAGTGLGSAGTAQDPILFNTGLLNVTAGTDIEIDVVPSIQTPTIHHLLSKQARNLLESDASNPVVRYQRLSSFLWGEALTTKITGTMPSNLEWLAILGSGCR
jgi:hypothetical protein